MFWQMFEWVHWLPILADFKMKLRLADAAAAADPGDRISFIHLLAPRDEQRIEWETTPLYPGSQLRQIFDRVAAAQGDGVSGQPLRRDRVDLETGGRGHP